MRRTRLGRKKSRKGKAPEAPAAAKGKPKFTQVRYRTRIIKGSFLPILFGIISLILLNNTVLQYPDYYKYETLLILFGFLLGIGSMIGVTASNLSRAKSKAPKGVNYAAPGYNPGINLSSMLGLAVFIPFIIINIVLALFFGLALAWQFSIGFFFAAIFPILIVLLYEVGSNGKFFVQESPEGEVEFRRLVFVPS